MVMTQDFQQHCLAFKVIAMIIEHKLYLKSQHIGLTLAAAEAEAEG